MSDRSPDPDNTFRNDLFTLDVATGATTRLTDTPAAEFLPVWSPDGQWIAFEGWARAGNTKDSPAEDAQVYIVAVTGGPSWRIARAFDRRVTEIGWHPSGNWIYFTAADHGATRVYRVATPKWQTPTIASKQSAVLIIDLAPLDSLPIVVSGGARQARGYSFDAGGSTMSFLSSDPTHPTEVWIAAADGAAPRQLTHLHDAVLRDIALEAAEPFWFKSFDGTPVQGWVMKPAGFHPARRYRSRASRRRWFATRAKGTVSTSPST